MKWVHWLAAVTMVMVLSTAVLAAGTPEAAPSDAVFEMYAEELKQLGLFRGTDKGFELDRAPTRTEAVVMLIRLLGKEEEALSSFEGAASHPFKDVPGWADPYISYAYRNKLTNGIAEDMFGANHGVTAPQYFTFILRSLGYSDADGHFEWSRSGEKAIEVGIVTHEDYLQELSVYEDGVPEQNVFLRGHLVDISYGALGAKVKGQDTTLMQRLISDGVVPAPQPDARLGKMEGTKLIFPVKVHNPEKGEYIGYLSSIAEVLPGANHIVRATVSRDYYDSVSRREFYDKSILASALSNPSYGERTEEFIFETIQPRPDYFYHYIILGQDLSWLAFATSDDLSIDGDNVEIAFETNIGIDCQAIMKAVLGKAERSIIGAQEFSNQVLYHGTHTYLLGDGSKAVANTMKIDRAGLPAAARSFTYWSQIEFYMVPPERLAAGASEIRSLDDIDVPQRLLRNRISHFAITDYYRDFREHRRYGEDSGIPLNDREWTSGISLLVLLLEDDAGSILAYTAFDEADLARIAR